MLVRRPDGRGTVRGIDVAFVAMERAPGGLPSGTVPFAPDLAIEVISPGKVAEDIHNKIRELLGAGTKLVLVVYPHSKTVVAHTRAGAHTYEADETLDIDDVLPGFRLTVKDIFDI